jgi:hypothetical protein
MRLKCRTAGAENGSAMVLVVFMTSALLLLSVTLIDAVQGDSSRSAQGVTRDAVFHAAEAGINDYTSKLLDDNQYYLHDVAAGEATRSTSLSCSGGQQVSSTSSTPAEWSYGTTWAYCSGKNNWRQLSNGYEYNLQVTGPTTQTQWVKIVATGRKQNTTAPVRVIEERIRPASVADFQMLSNADISYGSSATTRGKIYAGIDSNNVKHNVDHDGTAYADIYAEGQATGSTTLISPAKKYDVDSNPTIRTVIKNPINFSSFATSLTDIKRAADVGGLHLNSTSVAGWRLTFSSAGTVTVQGCAKTSGNPIETTSPTCNVSASGNGTYTVPTNGAIYVEQSVIIGWSSGTSTVDGRVTVASEGNVVIGGNVNYEQEGDDVLGLIAKNEVIVAKWTPSSVSWRAATVAQTGAWRSAQSQYDGHSTMTFTGSTATAQGGYMSMFATRNYNYDDSLLYLQPPWFPTIEYGYTVLVFRELPPS